MSGGRIVVFPPHGSTFEPSKNVIAGNTLLYGATGGEAYLSGTVGERFAVRNSGATAVVEGLGDHGCEYMTGGTIVVLGETGRNFAAGMSGGVAYIYDPEQQFPSRVNREQNLLLESVEGADADYLRGLVETHATLTGSARAKHLLADWDNTLPQFVKVISREYKTLIEKQAAVSQNGHTSGTDGIKGAGSIAGRRELAVS